MTCIVGVLDKSGIYIGGDSAGVAGLDLRIRRDPKVFVRGEFIYGYTSSFRMGQLLRYSFAAPDRSAKHSVHDYIYGPWIEAVRKCFKDGGYARTDSNVDSGGCFIVGYQGHLFAVESDFQVAEYPEGFAAVGCGADFALGTVHALAGAVDDPRRLVTRALETAEYFSAGVRRPFIVEFLPAIAAEGAA